MRRHQAAAAAATPQAEASTDIPSDMTGQPPTKRATVDRSRLKRSASDGVIKLIRLVTAKTRQPAKHAQLGGSSASVTAQPADAALPISAKPANAKPVKPKLKAKGSAKLKRAASGEMLTKRPDAENPAATPCIDVEAAPAAGPLIEAGAVAPAPLNGVEAAAAAPLNQAFPVVEAALPPQAANGAASLVPSNRVEDRSAIRGVAARNVAARFTSASSSGTTPGAAGSVVTALNSNPHCVGEPTHATTHGLTNAAHVRRDNLRRRSSDELKAAATRTYE